MEAPVFSREPNGLIALRITQDEWDELLITIGYAGGAMANAGDAAMFNRNLRLINRLNAGNPDFIPYEVPAEAPLTMTNTRDNFVAHAVRRRTCPECSMALDMAADPVQCGCGFRFTQQEAKRHRQ